MTKSDIAALTDRPLDLAVAKHVFGWKWRLSNQTGHRCLLPNNRVPSWFGPETVGQEPLVADFNELMDVILPPYSTTGDGMLAVIERMQALGWFYIIYGDVVEILEHGCRFYQPGQTDAVTIAKSAPEAVCRAALIAVLGMQE